MQASVKFNQTEQLPVRLCRSDNLQASIGQADEVVLQAADPIKQTQQLSASFREAGAFHADLGDVSVVGVPVDVPEYTGSYQITPGEAAITLPTSGKRAAANIVINPIPDNYGRISFDGYALTVY